MKTTKKTTTKRQTGKKESEASSGETKAHPAGKPAGKIEEVPLFSFSFDWMGKRISNVDSFFKRYRKVDG